MGGWASPPDRDRACPYCGGIGCSECVPELVDVADAVRDAYLDAIEAGVEDEIERLLEMEERASEGDGR